MDGFAERAGAFAVDDANRKNSAVAAGLQVGLDDLSGFARGERVQIEFAGDGDANGLGRIVVGGHQSR